MPQSAYGALLLIGLKDALAEGALVQALLDFRGDVVAAQGDLACGGGVVGLSEGGGVVYLDGEEEALGVVVNPPAIRSWLEYACESLMPVSGRTQG